MRRSRTVLAFKQLPGIVLEHREGQTRGTWQIVAWREHPREVAGSMTYEITDAPSWPLRHGRLHVDSVHVNPPYRRQGLATAMYVWAEKLTGRKFAPSQKQSHYAVALWSQPSRPFGMGR